MSSAVLGPRDPLLGNGRNWFEPRTSVCTLRLKGDKAPCCLQACSSCQLIVALVVCFELIGQLESSVVNATVRDSIPSRYFTSMLDSYGLRLSVKAELARQL